MPALRTQLPAWVVSQLHNLESAETPRAANKKAQSLEHLIDPRMGRRQEEGDVGRSSPLQDPLPSAVEPGVPGLP